MTSSTVGMKHAQMDAGRRLIGPHSFGFAHQRFLSGASPLRTSAQWRHRWLRSLYKFWRPYFLPDIAVRGPDGEVWSRGWEGSFYFSQTTTYWVDYERDMTDPSGESITSLVYHPDHGLVRGPNNHVLRRQLVDGAGPLLEEGERINGTNVAGIPFSLRDVEGYTSRDCHMPLISFEPSHR